MSKTGVISLAIILIVISVMGTRYYERNFTSRPTPQADTVYVDKPYEVTKYKKVKEDPKTVTIYKTDTVQVERLEIRHDTVVVNKEIKYNENFFTNYTQSPKLLGGSYQSPNLSLAYQKTNGTVEQQTWSVNDRDWELGFVNGTPTIETSPKRGFRLNHSVSVGYLFSNSIQSPYIGYQAKLNWRNINLKANAYASEESVGMVGIGYDF